MRVELKKIGVVKDGSVWPQDISHYITLKKVYYDNDIIESQKEIGDYECWDSGNKVFIKEI